MKKYIILMLLFLLVFKEIKAQNSWDNFIRPADQPNTGRLIGVSVGTAILYSLSMYFLYRAWYKGYPRTRFHSFNDNREWLQMDKLGHAATSYNIARGYSDIMRWSGVDNTAAAITGAAVALLFQTSIEVFDGYSEAWGFSWGDVIANTAGAGLFMGQQMGWQDQRITMKVGWRKSVYAKWRPELLGKSIPQQMLKDYNGEHSWVSFNIASLIPVGPDFPKWLNFAVGHSGNGLIGGHANPVVKDSEGKEIKFERYRQWYIGPDYDLERIPSNSPTANTLVSIIRFVKLPAPSLEFNRINKVRFNPLFVRNKPFPLRAKDGTIKPIY